MHTKARVHLHCIHTSHTHQEHVTALRIKLTSPVTPLHRQPNNALAMSIMAGTKQKNSCGLPNMEMHAQETADTIIHVGIIPGKKHSMLHQRGELPRRSCHSLLRTISSSQTTSVTIPSHKCTHKSCHCDSTEHSFLFKNLCFKNIKAFAADTGMWTLAGAASRVSSCSSHWRKSGLLAVFTHSYQGAWEAGSRKHRGHTGAGGARPAGKLDGV